MSIILNALKNSDGEKDKKTERAPVNDEGFFKPGQTIIKKERSFKLPEINKRTKVLLLIFVCACVFSFTVYKIKNYQQTRSIPTKIEILQPEAIQQAVSQTTTGVAPAVQAPSAPVSVTAAEAAFNSGKYDDSLKMYKAELDKDKNNALLHNNVGMIYLKKELYASASDEFRKALEVDNNCEECFNNFGYLKTLLGENQEAQKYFEKAIKINSTYPDPYFNLAVLFEKDGDIGNAVKYFQQFVTLYPDKNAQLVNDINKRINFLKGK